MRRGRRRLHSAPTTWQSSTGSLETRWPADPTLQASDGPLSGTTPDGAIRAVATVPTTTSSGLTAQSVLVYFPKLPSGCNTLQATVYDRDPARVAALIQQLAAHPFVATTPTVTAHTSAAVGPAVATCQAPAGITPPANRTAVVRTSAYATPDDAVERLPRHEHLTAARQLHAGRPRGRDHRLHPRGPTRCRRHQRARHPHQRRLDHQRLERERTPTPGAPTDERTDEPNDVPESGTSATRSTFVRSNPRTPRFRHHLRLLLGFALLSATGTIALIATTPVVPADAICRGAGGPAILFTYDTNNNLVAEEALTYPGTTCNNDATYQGAVLDPITDGSCAYAYYLEPFAYYAAARRLVHHRGVELLRLQRHHRREQRLRQRPAVVPRRLLDPVVGLLDGRWRDRDHDDVGPLPIRPIERPPTSGSSGRPSRPRAGLAHRGLR